MSLEVAFLNGAETAEPTSEGLLSRVNVVVLKKVVLVVEEFTTVRAGNARPCHPHLLLPHIRSVLQNRYNRLRKRTRQKSGIVLM